MPAPDQLLVSYGARYDLIRSELAAAIGRAWALAGGVSDRHLAVFVRLAVPLVQGAQQATAAITTAYLAAMIDELTGAPPAAAAVDARRLSGPAIRGTPPSEVYARPIITARRMLSEGRTLTDALNAARARALNTAQTDVVLAHRAAAAAVLEADARIVGYRRVLTGRSCMLCATASSQRYRRGDLMPIHDHCDCRVSPITGDADPGRIVNRQLLANLRQQGGSTYWKDRGFVDVDDDGTFRVRRAGVDEPQALRVAVREHGELGPTLVDADHAWTGTADL